MIFLFNFSGQFAPAVQSGEKRQTFRRERLNGKRPQPGDTFKGYSGLRTHRAKLLVEAPVVQCRGARLDVRERTLVIDGHNLSERERQEFARHDGFPDFDTALKWFADTHIQHEIEGFLVEWDYERRVRS